VARELIAKGITDVRVLEGGWQAWLDHDAQVQALQPAVPARS
jgi:3-mercaptopyruvate sulfurtransferase SseA